LDGDHVKPADRAPDKPFFFMLSNFDTHEAGLFRGGAKSDLETSEQALAAYLEPSRPAEELYHLSADPDEMHNLADSPKFRDELLRLRAELDRWLTEAGDIGEYAEVDMVTDHMLKWSG